MSDTKVHIPSAAAVGGKKNSDIGKYVRWMPMFVAVFVFYIIGAVSVANVRSVFYQVGGYQFTFVELIIIFGALVAMFELLRVSKPGIDNTGEAMAMMLATVGFLVFFVLASTGIPLLNIFARTEFLALLIISGVQSVLAIMINARTLKRTIDYTGGE